MAYLLVEDLLLVFALYTIFNANPYYFIRLNRILGWSTLRRNFPLFIAWVTLSVLLTMSLPRIPVLSFVSWSTSLAIMPYPYSCSELMCFFRTLRCICTTVNHWKIDLFNFVSKLVNGCLAITNFVHSRKLSNHSPSCFHQLLGYYGLSSLFSHDRI